MVCHANVTVRVAGFEGRTADRPTTDSAVEQQDRLRRPFGEGDSAHPVSSSTNQLSCDGL